MRILYFDCPTGISGDMCLGALIDLGVDFNMVLSELKKLPVDEIDVKLGREVRHSITGTSFRVRVHETHHHRTFLDIKNMIEGSALAPVVKKLSVSIFELIAAAEGKVHGIPADEVHFHEVGAMDSIIDIVGAAVALDSLKVDRFCSSALPLGSGWTNTMHGRMPIPAPATLEILKGVPVLPSEIPFELTTPTGAAILKAVSSGFGRPPAMTIEKTGYGAGKKDFKEAANLVRVIMGEAAEGPMVGEEKLIVLETNIDDMSPQIAGYMMERLFAAGALDAFFTPVHMKKSRPGILLNVLTDGKKKEALLDVIFRESTSIGVRSYMVERECLERKIISVRTPYGEIRVKVSYRRGELMSAQPEYEDCRRAAGEHGVALKLVMEEAGRAVKTEEDSD